MPDAPIQSQWQTDPKWPIVLVTLDLRPVFLLHVVCQDWHGIFVPKLLVSSGMAEFSWVDHGWDKKWQLLRLLLAIPVCSADPHQVKWRYGCQSLCWVSSDIWWCGHFKIAIFKIRCDIQVPLILGEIMFVGLWIKCIKPLHFNTLSVESTSTKMAETLGCFAIGQAQDRTQWTFFAGLPFEPWQCQALWKWWTAVPILEDCGGWPVSQAEPKRCCLRIWDLARCLVPGIWHWRATGSSSTSSNPASAGLSSVLVMECKCDRKWIR